MYSLSVQNEAGEKLELTHNANYDVIKIDGLNPPTATINTSTITNFDGGRFNSSRMNMRNIVITLCPSSPVDENRIALYRYFKSKQWIRIFYKNRLRDIYIDGYVESFEDDFFTVKQQIQISIICPSPYFKSTKSLAADFNNTVNMFEVDVELPEEGMSFSEETGEIGTIVNNVGDTSTGMMFTCNFSGIAVELNLWDVGKAAHMTIEYEFFAGDQLVVNTNKGNKSIILMRNCERYNLINYLTSDSSWLILAPGANKFIYTMAGGSENVDIVIDHVDLFEGV